MKRRRTFPVHVEAVARSADAAATSPRQLVYVPILHCPSDMGSAADKLADAYIERFGRQHWQEFLALIKGFWQTVRAALDRLDLDWRQVDLYQDGLPLCGREREIVTKAAEGGSQNHQLLLELMSRGAGLVGTEDPRLLLQEYQAVQAALAKEPAASVSPVARASRPCVPRASCPRASSEVSSTSSAGPQKEEEEEEEEEEEKKETTGGGTPPGRKGKMPSPRQTPAAHESMLPKRDAYIARRIGQTLQPGRTGVLFIGMMHHVESYLPADIVVRRLDAGDGPAEGASPRTSKGTAIRKRKARS